jgi:hypothetical protein
LCNIFFPEKKKNEEYYTRKELVSWDLSGVVAELKEKKSSSENINLMESLLSITPK